MVSIARAGLESFVDDYEPRHVTSDFLVAYGDSHDRAVEIICTAENQTGKKGYFEAGVYCGDTTKLQMSFSSQVGCPCGCPTCELGDKPWEWNLSQDQIYEQVILMLREASRFAKIEGEGIKLKVGPGKTGEPLLNPEIVEAMERIADLGCTFRFPTLFPKGKGPKEVFRRMSRFASFCEEPVQVHISLASTDAEYRAKFTKVGADFATIRQALEEWTKDNPPPKGRKPNIIFIMSEQTPIDPKKLVDLFPPDLVNVALRPYVATKNGVRSGLSTVSRELIEGVATTLKEYGYKVFTSTFPTPTELRFGLCSNVLRRRYLDIIGE